MHIARRCFFFTALQFVVIRCNNALYRLIAPGQKETTMHAKYHPTENFRLNESNYSDHCGNCSDCPNNSSVQGAKCEFTRVNDHFVTPKWRIIGAS